MHDVDVWVTDLDASGDAPAILSADELERAARFHFERDRVRFMRCRTLLRQLIARATGRGAASLTFRYNAYGKPELEDIHFNVSHSANVAVIALATAPIGIDVESIDPTAEVMSLARTAFSSDECAALSAMPPDDRVPAFFRGWARKEAYLKLLGTGFSLPSGSFSVSLDAEPLTYIGDVAVRDVAIKAGFACAIAMRGGAPPPLLHKV